LAKTAHLKCLAFILFTLLFSTLIKAEDHQSLVDLLAEDESLQTQKPTHETKLVPKLRIIVPTPEVGLKPWQKFWILEIVKTPYSAVSVVLKDAASGKVETFFPGDKIGTFWRLKTIKDNAIVLQDGFGNLLTLKKSKFPYKYEFSEEYIGKFVEDIIKEAVESKKEVAKEERRKKEKEERTKR